MSGKDELPFEWTVFAFNCTRHTSYGTLLVAHFSPLPISGREQVGRHIVESVNRDDTIPLV